MTEAADKPAVNEYAARMADVAVGWLSDLPAAQRASRIRAFEHATASVPVEQ